MKKIGGFTRQGTINATNAAEARHLFFVSSSLSAWFATHPPLDQRIKAIDATWNEIAPGEAPPAIADSDDLPIMGLAAARSSTSPVHAAMAQMLGLLIPAKPETWSSLRAILNEQGISPAIAERAIAIAGEPSAEPMHRKLDAIHRSLPALRQMSPQEARRLIDATQALIMADGLVDLFEFMLQQVIRRHIEIGTGLKPVAAITCTCLQDLEEELANLLSLFAMLAGQASAIAPAATEYHQLTGRALPDRPADFGASINAIGTMDAASPLVKQQILGLCTLVVMDDQTVNENEEMLLRATAAAMGSPMPAIPNGLS